MKEEKNIYVGNRYVPKIMGEWNKQEPYEGLSIVTHEGTSYTSKKGVPIGVDILNENYWVVTGNYNAQIENYRKDVKDVKNDLIALDFLTSSRMSKITVYPETYGAKGDGVTNDSEAIQEALNSGFNVTFKRNTTYIVKDLQLSTSYITLKGDNSVLQTPNNESSIISVTSKTEHVLFYGLTFKGFADGTNNTVVGISLQRTSPTALRNESTKNITIDNCSFTGFVIAIMADGTTGLTVKNSYSSGQKYVPTVGAGGYFILLHTSYNTTITDNVVKGITGDRHAIYASADSKASINRQCEDITITNNLFDWSAVASIGGFESPIVIRSSINVLVTTNIIKKGIHGIVLNPSYGDIDSLTITNNHFLDIRGNGINDHAGIACVPSDGEEGFFIKRLIITSNVITSRDKNVGGIGLQKTFNTTISNNSITVQGLNGVGIGLQRATDTTISSNTLNGNDTGRSGIRFSTDENDGVFMSNNNIRSFVNYSEEYLNNPLIKNFSHNKTVVASVRTKDGVAIINLNPNDFIEKLTPSPNGVYIHFRKYVDVKKLSYTIRQRDSIVRQFYFRGENLIDNSIHIGIKDVTGAYDKPMFDENMLFEIIMTL